MLTLMTAEAWAGVVGALLGAIISGLIAWLIQHSALARSNSARILAEEKANRIHLSLLYDKLDRMQTSTNAIKAHVDQMVVNATKIDSPERWVEFHPINNPPDSIIIRDSEIATILGDAQFELNQKVRAAIEGCVEIRFICQFHSDRYHALHALLAENEIMTIGYVSLVPSTGALAVNYTQKRFELLGICDDFVELATNVDAKVNEAMSLYSAYYAKKTTCSR